jgi:glycosyltransferase 2 family protein
MASSRVGRLVLLLFVFVVLAVVSRLDLHAMQAAFAEASWTWIAVTALVNLSSMVIEAARWQVIVGGTRRIAILSAIQGLLVGWVGNLILPFKLGDGARAWVVAKREELSIATVISTVVLDHAVDGLALVLFIVLASTIMPLPASMRSVRAWGVVILLCVVAAVAVGRRWVRAQRRAGRFAEGTLARVLDGFAVLGQQHRLVSAGLLALATWFARMTIVWCAMQAFDLKLPLAAAASVLVAINLGISAVAVPGNLGVFELSAAGALALWSVSGAKAVSFAIALHAAELIPTVLLGLIVQSTIRAPLGRPTQ